MTQVELILSILSRCSEFEGRKSCTDLYLRSKFSQDINESLKGLEQLGVISRVQFPYKSMGWALNN